MPETLTLAKTIDISKARVINGFMDPKELEWLAQRAAEHTRIAEVGSFMGRSTRALCDHTLGEVHAYDDFYGPRDHVMSYNARRSIRVKFDENMRDHLDSGLLHVHDEDHTTLEPEGMFDMIFIDGEHDYKEVKRDIEKWLGHLSPGGLICGHDFDIAWPGVLRATAEVFQVPGVVCVAPGTTIWYAVSQ